VHVVVVDEEEEGPVARWIEPSQRLLVHQRGGGFGKRAADDLEGLEAAREAARRAEQ
jgi:hypothetical protein